MLAGCADSNCVHVDDYVFMSTTPNVSLSDGPQSIQLKFYPQKEASLSFPKQPLQALQIKDGISEFDRTALKPENTITRKYSKKNPLILGVTLSQDIEKRSIIVEPVGSYAGFAKGISFYLHKSDTCAYALDSDPYFVSLPITITE